MAEKSSRKTGIVTEYDGVVIPFQGPQHFPDRDGGRMLWERDEARRSVRDAAARAASYAHLAIVRGEDFAAEGLLAEAVGLMRALRLMAAAEREVAADAKS